MEAVAINFTSLLRDIPGGEWVAIASDREHVVCHGTRMAKVLQEAKQRGEDEPIIMRVPRLAGSWLL